MYSVDEKDRVLILKNVPRPSIVAPLPFVMSDEHTLLFAYKIQEDAPVRDGSFIGVVDPNSLDEPVALVEFSRYYAYIFGPPYDEAFGGHPLADRGLSPYAVFQIVASSWVRRLERMNSVHLNFRPKKFNSLNHYIFTFHDSTFECVAEVFTIIDCEGSLRALLPETRKRLRW